MAIKELTETTTKRPIPRKLNPGMIQALSEVIAKGNYATVACQLCGISEDCFYSWLEQSREDQENGLTSENSLYLRLAESLKRAESQAEAELVNVVRESATVKKEWLPAMTFLERRHPDRWGRKDRTRVDINEKKSITITHVEVVLNQGDSQAPVVEGESRELKEGE